MKRKRRFNWIVSDYLRKFLKVYYEGSARLRGKRFYCAALQGRGDYNITINCDLTVSCNCQDYDASGHLGDLRKNTFQEVFFGPKAQEFRRKLAQGKIPIMSCTRCGDLKRIAKSQVPKALLEEGGGEPIPPAGEDKRPTAEEIWANEGTWPPARLPYRGMQLENTVSCNIDCIGCDRENAALRRVQKQMSLADLTTMGDLVAQLGLQQLFYLNLGEPFLSPNIGQELLMLRQKNPNCRIVIATNGILLNTDVKREAAMSASHLFFSIAGIDDEMLKKYEKRGSFDKAFAGIKGLVDYRNAKGLSKPLIEWKYLLFNWNDKRETIQRAIEMAKSAGVDAISFWPTNNPYYGFSWRYRMGQLNNVGIANWKGREVNFRAMREAEGMKGGGGVGAGELAAAKG